MPADAYRLERTSRPYVPYGSDREIPNATLKATRPLTSDDLARFSLYAPFVRRVIPRYRDWRSWEDRIGTPATRYNDDDVSPELWDTLQSIWPSRLLDLEVLEYRQVAYIDRKMYAHPLHLFFGSSMKKLDLTVLYLKDDSGRVDNRVTDATTQDPNLEALLRRLSQLAPHLATFSLDPGWGVIARDALSEALCGLSQLTSVKVDRTLSRPRTMHHLSTLPALHSLEIRLPPREELDAETWPTGVTGRFPALRELVMHAQQLDECIDVLSHVTSSTLSKITAYVSKSSSTGTFQALASVVSRLPHSQRSIRSLAFMLYWNEGLLTEALDPLLSLSSLEKLALGDGVHAIVDDATLCRMAQSWPKIRHLALYSWVDDTTPQHDTQATVHGLRYLAQCCPDLKTVYVPLSDISAATLAPPAASRTYPQLDPARPHSLEWLGVGRPRLHDETALAAYLSCLFPALTTIEHCWNSFFMLGGVFSQRALEERAIQNRWRALLGVYQAFVEIRAQERSWRAVQTVV